MKWSGVLGFDLGFGGGGGGGMAAAALCVRRGVGAVLRGKRDVGVACTSSSSSSALLWWSSGKRGNGCADWRGREWGTSRDGRFRAMAASAAETAANEMSGTQRQAAFELARGPTAHTLANALIRPTSTQGKEQDMRIRLHKLFRDDEGGGDDAHVTAPGFIFDVPLRRDIVHTVVRWQLAKRRSSVNAHTKTQGTVHGTTRKPHKQKGTGKARQGSRRGPHFRGGGVAFGPTNQKVHEIGCNRRIRRKALTIALSARLAEGRLFIVDSLRPDPESEMDAGKTKVMLESVARLIGESDQTNPSCLVVHGSSKSGGVPVDIEGTDIENDDDQMAEEEEEEEEEEAETVVAVKRDSDAFDIKAVDEDVDVEKIKRSSSNLRSVDIIDQIGLNVYSILRRKYLVISKAALSDLVLRLSIPIRPRERYLLALELERQEHVILKGDTIIDSRLEDLPEEAQQQQQ